MASSNGSAQAEFERTLLGLFQREGWSVLRRVSGEHMRANVVADSGGQRFLVELKRVSEGRRDRLVPLLAQAILQSRAAAERLSPHTLPVAVIASDRITTSVAEEAKQFAQDCAPEVGVGMIDGRGLRVFTGHGLEQFDAKPAARLKSNVASRPRLPNLFSDLNQWMLKILLGQVLPETLVSVPRAKFRNASQLAAAANVSTMSAYRFLHRLTKEGFLDRGRGHLRIVRVDELLDRWAFAVRRAFREIPVRWILKQDRKQLNESLANYVREDKVPGRKSSGVTRTGPRAKARCCLGLFAAADNLGLGFVTGVPRRMYLETLDPDVLENFGLWADDSGSPPDLYVRVPNNREAIFRSAPFVNGVPVADVLQVWLDASTHPARGREQANLIRHRAFGPLLS